MTCLHATGTCGKLSQKREMLSNKASSLMMAGTPSCMKLRINAGDKSARVTQDKAIADAYGNKFIIPLNFEMLDSAMPYYQAGLRNRLSYKLNNNNTNNPILNLTPEDIIQHSRIE